MLWLLALTLALLVWLLDQSAREELRVGLPALGLKGLFVAIICAVAVAFYSKNETAQPEPPALLAFALAITLSGWAFRAAGYAVTFSLVIGGLASPLWAPSTQAAWWARVGPDSWHSGAPWAIPAAEAIAAWGLGALLSLGLSRAWVQRFVREPPPRWLEKIALGAFFLATCAQTTRPMMTLFGGLPRAIPAWALALWLGGAATLICALLARDELEALDQARALLSRGSQVAITLASAITLGLATLLGWPLSPAWVYLMALLGAALASVVASVDVGIVRRQGLAQLAAILAGFAAGCLALLFH